MKWRRGTGGRAGAPGPAGRALHQGQAGAAEMEFEEEVILVGVEEILDGPADAAPGDLPFGVVLALPAQVGAGVDIVEGQPAALFDQRIVPLDQVGDMTRIVQLSI